MLRSASPTRSSVAWPVSSPICAAWPREGPPTVGKLQPQPLQHHGAEPLAALLDHLVVAGPGAADQRAGHAVVESSDMLLALWDGRLARRVAADSGIDGETVEVVKIVDLLARADRLSPLDGFHPSAAAYREIARRVASMLGQRSRAA